MESRAHIRRLWALSLLAFSAACLSTAGQAPSQIQSIDGLWDATVTVNNVPMRGRFEWRSARAP